MDLCLIDGTRFFGVGGVTGGFGVGTAIAAASGMATLFSSPEPTLISSWSDASGLDNAQKFSGVRRWSGRALMHRRFTISSLVCKATPS